MKLQLPLDHSLGEFAETLRADTMASWVEDVTLRLPVAVGMAVVTARSFQASVQQLSATRQTNSCSLKADSGICSLSLPLVILAPTLLLGHLPSTMQMVQAE